MLLKSQQLQIYKYPLTKLLKLWKMIDEFIMIGFQFSGQLQNPSSANYEVALKETG